VAQWEREAIGERTSAAMQHLRAEGRYTGGRCRYGYRVDADGRLVPDDTEQAALAAVAELRAAGLSLRAISAELAARGFLSRTGRPFTASTLHNLAA
jgi:DNA invertase Pin-like site-specific DNA recombinase